MALTKVTYTDKETVITAENLNAIQDEVIALETNKAPAGYGLGTISYGQTGTYFTDAAELDDLTVNSFWCYRNTTTPLAEADANTKFVKGMTISYGHTNVTQIGYCVYTITTIIRRCIDGEWTEWEFENTPMAAGVEYPTTERSRNGAAVYRKRVTYTNAEAFGTAGTATTVEIPHEIENFGTLVRCIAKGAGYPLPHIGSTGHMTGVLSVDATNIKLRTLNAWAANNSWDFDIAYTKTS